MKEWTQQDIYNLLRSEGLNGLLREFRLLNEWIQKTPSNSSGKENAKKALSLMKSQITSKVSYSGKLFFLLSADTKCPYMDCFDSLYDFRTYLFSDLVLANTYKKELFDQGYPTDVLEIVTGKHRESFFKSLMLAGVNFVIIDKGENEFAFKIENFSPNPGYDGYLDVNFPLINRRLNAIVSEYVQDCGIKKVSPELEKELFKTIKNSFFTFPVFEDGEIDRLDHKEIIYSHCVIQLESTDNTKDLVIPVFTDYESLDNWAKESGVENYVTLITPFSKLGEIINEYNVEKFILNWNTHSLILDKNLLIKIYSS